MVADGKVDVDYADILLVLCVFNHTRNRLFSDFMTQYWMQSYRTGRSRFASIYGQSNFHLSCRSFTGLSKFIIESVAPHVILINWRRLIDIKKCAMQMNFYPTWIAFAVQLRYREVWPAFHKGIRTISFSELDGCFMWKYLTRQKMSYIFLNGTIQFNTSEKVQLCCIHWVSGDSVTIFKSLTQGAYIVLYDLENGYF